MAQGETTQGDGCTVTEHAGPGLTSAVLNEDATFIFPQSDNYWCPSVTVGKGLYEPEIDWLMQRACDKPYAMLDCGANLGYWSVLASSAPYGRHAVVAIEVSLSVGVGFGARGSPVNTCLIASGSARKTQLPSCAMRRVNMSP